MTSPTTRMVDAPKRPRESILPAGRRRIRMREWSRTDLIELLAALCGSFALTWFVYEEMTPLTGGFGFSCCLFVSFLVVYGLMVHQRLGGLAARDRLAASTILVVGLVMLVALALILGYVAVRGIHALRSSFFTEDQFGVGPLAPATAGGGLAAIVGTAEQVGLATLISLPLGIATAVFLSEVRGPMTRPVRLMTDAMSGIPSILTGLFIYAVLIYSHILPESGFAVSLALTISMLPTITRTSEVALRVIPGGYREASLALGATDWKTTRRILLPTARTGLMTAAILGVARVVGEAAPGIIDAGGSSKVNYNPFNGPQENLPLMIYEDIKSFVPAEHLRAWTAGLVLVMLVLLLFVIARLVARRSPGHVGRIRRRRLDRRRPDPKGAT